LTDHLNRYQRLVETTCDQIKSGTYARPQHIVDGIREELEQGLSFGWFGPEQRDEMVRWMQEAIETPTVHNDQ
jgi:hypothetical protein